MPYAKHKVLVPLARRNKKVKRHIRLIERYHKTKVALAYEDYYKDAIF